MLSLLTFACATPAERGGDSSASSEAAPDAAGDPGAAAGLDREPWQPPVLAGGSSNPVETGSSPPPDAGSPDYTISASDLLQVRVYQEEDLAREVRVSARGNINLPLIETVFVMGKTVAEAEELLTELYDSEYLVNPQINISVLEYSQRRVNVLGAVNQPGTVVFPPEESMNLIDAISRAGGFQRSANSRAVRLTRSNEGGSMDRFVVNTDEIIQGNTDFTWTLQGGDVIFVPERAF